MSETVIARHIMSPSSQNTKFSGRILVISKDPDDHASIRSSMERDGYSIAIKEGLSDIHHLDFGSYALILLELPVDRAAAIESVEKIKQSISWQHIPLVVFSESKSSEFLVDMLNAGADDYLIKPFSARELAARTRAVIRSTKKKYRSEH